MLSAFVNEHQNDWDEHLPYISMAYRAAEHETIGITPNYIMLGREVTTPLDRKYCSIIPLDHSIRLRMVGSSPSFLYLQ
jgi:hypothetical protein